MELRALVIALISILNFAVETLEKLVSEDGGDGEKNGKPSTKAKSSRSSKAKAKDEEEEEEKGEVSEDDVIDAVRAAQKVLERADIKKILKKHGNADRASEVEPELRQKVIDALEKAIEDAE